jgi:chromosome segregation ATPase
MESAVLQPDIVQNARHVALERLRPTLEARLRTRAPLEREAAVQTEIDRLVAAVAGGGMLNGLLEGLQAREARRADLDRQIAALTAQEDALKVDWATVKMR